MVSQKDVTTHISQEFLTSLKRSKKMIKFLAAILGFFKSIKNLFKGAEQFENVSVKKPVKKPTKKPVKKA